MAPLRASVDGHFGPELRRFALAYIVRDKSRRWPLVKLLRGIGILISKRQVVARVLIAGKQGFVEEAPALLWGRLTGAARVAGIKARSQPKKRDDPPAGGVLRHGTGGDDVAGPRGVHPPVPATCAGSLRSSA
jgi:hypothetical protein